MEAGFIHPSLLLILGALLVPFLQGPLRRPYLMLVPLLALAAVILNAGQHGTFATFAFLDWQLVFGRVDKLSTVFALIMGLMAVIGTIYGLHVDRAVEHMAAWFYAAGSLGAIYAGDYLTLFLFWEMMAFASVFLIWFRRGPQSIAVGYRYLLVHTIGGVILLAGIMLRYRAVGNITFDLMDVANPQLYTLADHDRPGLERGPGAAAFVAARGLQRGLVQRRRVPVRLHHQDRGLHPGAACAGMDILVVAGVVMALYGVIYAVMENDIRKLLAWSIVSQVGYMVAGIGLGTDMAINGAVAHAVVHILYKSLLFMGTGAVLYMTGRDQVHRTGRAAREDAPHLPVHRHRLSVHLRGPGFRRLREQVHDHRRRFRGAPVLGRLAAHVRRHRHVHVQRAQAAVLPVLRPKQLQPGHLAEGR